MANSIYHIHRDIDRPIEFHGVKAQFIILLALGFMILFALVTVMYYLDISRILLLVSSCFCGSLLVIKVQKLSRRYGQYGLMKAHARTHVPKAVQCRGRMIFIELRWFGRERP